MATLELPHTSGCLVCGRGNPLGLQLSLHVETETGAVSVPFQPRREQIGFDGIIHGGVLATVLDEAMVWAATWRIQRFCVCGEMRVRFRQNARVGDQLLVRATVQSARSKLVEVAGEVVRGTEILAVASSKMVPMPLDRHRTVVQTLLDEPHTAAAAVRLKEGLS